MNWIDADGNFHPEWSLAFAEQRDANGNLTDLALACNALQDNGCDCGTDEPGTCLACRCEAALKILYQQQVEAHRSACNQRTDMERAQRELAISNECLLAIAASFNHWANSQEPGDDKEGYRLAAEALMDIGDALGPPWVDSVRCHGCGGDGLTAQDEPQTCPVCGGTGREGMGEQKPVGGGTSTHSPPCTPPSPCERPADELDRMRQALTTIERSGAPGATIVAKRDDGHACGWCRGILTPCPVETARKALEGR